MIILHGKYNIAKVMLPNDLVDDEIILAKDDVSHYKYLDNETYHQILSFLNHPAFKGSLIVIMPDTHFGKGSCVGFTFEMNGYIIPNIVGVDIGCGVMSAKLGIKYSENTDLDVFDEFVRKVVPTGFSIHQEENHSLSTKFEQELNDWVALTGQDKNKVYRSIGTLGGGNHFIELGKDDDDYLWLTVHSGSRNFGLQIANYYQSIANAKCKRYFQDFGDLNFLPMADGMEEYLHAMEVAQEYAHENRLVMIDNLMKWWYPEVGVLELIDSVHNYIDLNDGIIRKGATPARLGQKVVIPFNMQDGLIIGEGLGNKDWNFSAPHGAGRLFSRKKAKAVLSLNNAQINMRNHGVFTTSLNENSLDEAPGAYKDKQLIIDMIKDTVKIEKFVKPIYNFKAA